MALQLRELTQEEEKALERLLHARSTPVGKLKRVKIIWLASQAKPTPEIAKQLEVSERMVRKWLKRFREQGLAGVEEAPRSGRPVSYQPELGRESFQHGRSHPRPW